jgi:pimeloyl-ACP methyl ester carboxylesterase
MLVASNGYRAVAHDRRGHGRSGQPWTGNDMDTYADDLAELIDALSLNDVILVGHSTGGARSPATSAGTAPPRSPRPCWWAPSRR